VCAATALLFGVVAVAVVSFGSTSDGSRPVGSVVPRTDATDTPGTGVVNSAASDWAVATVSFALPP